MSSWRDSVENIPKDSSWRDSVKPLTREEKVALLKESRNKVEPDEQIGDTAAQAFGNGMSMGYLPNLQALAEKPLAKVYDAINGTDVASTVEDDYIDRRDRWANRQKDLFDKNPTTAAVGNVAGGLVTGMAAGPLVRGAGAAASAIPGAARVAQGAKNAASVFDAATPLGRAMMSAGRTGVAYGALQNPGDEEGKVSGLQIGDRIINAGIGGAIGASIPLGIEGIRATGRGAVTLARAVKTGTVKGIEQIQEAARKLGVKLTPAMTSDSRVIQGLESSLEQSPTLGGALMRRQTEPIREGIEKNVEGLLADKTSLSPHEVGSKIKTGVMETIDNRLAPHREAFNSVREATQEIGVNPRSIGRVAGTGTVENPGTIGRMKAVELDLSGSSEASAVAQRLQKAKSIDDIKSIRTDLGRKLAQASKNNDPAAAVLSDLYGKVARLEESNLLRQGVAQARAGGVTPAKAEEAALQTLNDLRSAKKGFSGVANDLKAVAQESSLPKWAGDRPETFVSAIDGLQNEKVVKTLFDTGNYEGLRQFAKHFPQEFEVARQAYLAELAQKLDYSPKSGMAGIVDFTKNMQPEVRQLVFGADGTDKLGALKVMKDAFPKMTGPSGTPAGQEFRQVWRPDQQAASLLNYGAYRAMTSGAAQKAAAKAGSIGEMVANSPTLKKLAETNPAAFSALMSRLYERSSFKRQEDDPSSREWHYRNPAAR